MDGPRVAIVNETLARHFWPNGGAVARVITVGPDRVDVVGVVKDVQWTSALQQADPVAYPELQAAGPGQSVRTGFTNPHQDRGRCGRAAA